MERPLRLPGLTVAQSERLEEGLRAFAEHHNCTLVEAVKRTTGSWLPVTSKPSSAHD